MPRIRKAVGDDEFERLSKGHLCILCVVEYMSNRKKYDKEHHETEETTKMRDILTVLAEELLTQRFGEGLPMTRHSVKSKSPFHGAPLLCREVNETGTDALYFANPQHPQAPKSAGRQCFMLREPNTKLIFLVFLKFLKSERTRMCTKKFCRLSKHKVFPHHFSPCKIMSNFHHFSHARPLSENPWPHHPTTCIHLHTHCGSMGPVYLPTFS